MNINDMLLEYKKFYADEYEILNALNLLQPLTFHFTVKHDYEYYEYIWHKDWVHGYGIHIVAGWKGLPAKLLDDFPIIYKYNKCSKTEDSTLRFIDELAKSGH